MTAKEFILKKLLASSFIDIQKCRMAIKEIIEIMQVVMRYLLQLYALSLMQKNTDKSGALKRVAICSFV